MSSIFTGGSSYSKDFQSVIDRAVSIASLPIDQLKREKTDLEDQSTDLKTVDTKFEALRDSLDGISAALDGTTFEAEVTNENVATASVSTGAVEGIYSVKVVDAGVYATSLSTAEWDAAEGAAHTYEFWLGNTSYEFTPTDNSASSVAAALNQYYGDKVRASVVNVGPADDPDYRISMTAVKLGTGAVDIKYNSSSLQSPKAEGRLASYEVNGSGRTITSDARSVEIATGLTVHLVEANTTPVSISVMRSTSALADSLGKFVDAYNAAVDEVDRHRGLGEGKLKGESVVNDLASALSAMSTYADATSAVNNLATLGIQLGADGKLAFNQYKLMAADLTMSNGISTFLGTTTGRGFLKLAADQMDLLLDSTTGYVATAISSWQTRIDDSQSNIDLRQADVDQLERRLTEQMAAADSLIAGMEQQYSYMSNMFSAMRTASEQYK